MNTPYTKNDIVRFMTNEPTVHVNVMFNPETIDPDDIGKEEYIGRIKAVIARGRSYLVSTISPLEGFICIPDAEDIVCRMDESELDEDQRVKYHARDEHFEAPNCYENDPEAEDLKGLDEERKCFAVARKAIDSLFPGKDIVEMDRNFGDFRLERYLKDLDDSLELLPGERRSSKREKELLETKERLAQWFKTLRFKEFHMVNVGFREEKTAEDLEFEKSILKKMQGHFGKDFSLDDRENNQITKFWAVAVSTDFEEAYVLRDVRERTDFHMWLGPEHYDMDEASQKFFCECRGMKTRP